MDGWRELLQREFVPNVSFLTLVSDPNYLLSDEKLVKELKNRGFELIEYENSIEFRFTYESFYRSIWDKRESINLIVVLKKSEGELRTLPYDLYQAGRKLFFSIGKLFPNLSSTVVEKLDLIHLDKLFNAQTNLPPDRLGINPTKDYILRNVFGIAADTIITDVDLLRTLLRLHYGQIKIPTELALRFVSVLKNSRKFNDWELEQLVINSSSFFTFIQERWSKFVKELHVPGDSTEAESNGLKFDGPTHLSFEHHDIRVYMDNLFVERILNPVKIPINKTIKDSWIKCGILQPNEEVEEKRICRLFDLIGEIELSNDSSHTEWMLFAMKWADLSALIHTAKTNRYRNQLQDFRTKINGIFADWLESHYSFLMSLPPTKPVMLHQIPRYLARTLEKCVNKRIALVVIDGLSMDQWITIRNVIQSQSCKLIFQEDAIFAWIPTITSVSRQSIFRGKQPKFFSNTIENNNNEEKFWKLFWEDYGVSPSDVVYLRGLGNDDAEVVLEKFIHPLTTKIVGLVINKIDKIMHGMQLGSSGMHNQISQWCNEGFLVKLLEFLLEHEFEICITSDHGNLESVGKGRPNEGGIADIRGERVRVYPTKELRELVGSNFTFARKWNTIGLPKNFYPLVATGNNSFVNRGETIVGHGGISVEEVIVPLIKVERA